MIFFSTQTMQFTGEIGESFKEVKMAMKPKNICDADWKISGWGLGKMNPGFVCTMEHREIPSGGCYVSEFLIVL